MNRVQEADTEHYLSVLKTTLDDAKSSDKLYDAIVNAPFEDKVTAALMDLGIVVLLLVNKKSKTIDRIALSNTDHAQGAVSVSVKPFSSIKIPLGFTKNIIARAIDSGKPQGTSDWEYLFAPALSPQAARFNQAGAGIASSMVYPLTKPTDGALIFSYYRPIDEISSEQRDFMQAYAELVSTALRA